MKKDKKLKIYLGIIYLVILSLFLWVFFSKFSLNEITSYDFIKNNRNYLISIKDNSYLLTSILFIFFTIIWTLLLGFGSPIMLTAGFIFGKWIGTIFATLGLTVGALFLYLFANFFFKDLIKEKLTNKFEYIKNKIQKYEFYTILLYRFIGGIPFQIANLLPVLFNVQLKNYFLSTFLGIIPQVFIISSLGSGLESIIEKNIEPPSIMELVSSFEIYVPILSFLFLLIIVFALRKLFYKN